MYSVYYIVNIYIVIHRRRNTMKKMVIALLLIVTTFSLAACSQPEQVVKVEEPIERKCNLLDGSRFVYKDGYYFQSLDTNDSIPLPSDSKFAVGNIGDGIFFFEATNRLIVINAKTMEKRMITEAFKVDTNADMKKGEYYIELLDGTGALYSWEEGIH